MAKNENRMIKKATCGLRKCKYCKGFTHHGQ
jgi:hypothetical protein